MTTLADQLTKESVHSLHDAFVSGVLSLPRTPAGDVGLSAKTYEAVGVPIVRWVHQRLMLSAKPNDTGKLGSYPFYTTVGVYHIMADEGVTKANNPHSSPRLATDVARILAMSGVGRWDKKTHTWFLRPWDETKVEYYSSYDKKIMKVSAQDAKREKAEANKPVKVTRDLRKIKLPKKGTPAVIMEFIENFVPAALAVQAERDALGVHNKHLIERIEEVENQAAADAEATEWKGVGKKITDLLTGGGG